MRAGQRRGPAANVGASRLSAPSAGLAWGGPGGLSGCLVGPPHPQRRGPDHVPRDAESCGPRIGTSHRPPRPRSPPALGTVERGRPSCRPSPPHPQPPRPRSPCPSGGRGPRPYQYRQRPPHSHCAPAGQRPHTPGGAGPSGAGGRCRRGRRAPGPCPRRRPGRVAPCRPRPGVPGESRGLPPDARSGSGLAPPSGPGLPSLARPAPGPVAPRGASTLCPEPPRCRPAAGRPALVPAQPGALFSGPEGRAPAPPEGPHAHPLMTLPQQGLPPDHVDRNYRT
jgi:Wiskott-Aldrich syndrome protein